MKNSPSIFLIVLLLTLLFSVNCHAQSDNFPILSMDVYSIPIANDTTPEGLPYLHDSTIFSAEMHLSIFDTTDIDRIYVTLGDAGQSGNRLQHTFDWDVSGSTGNNTSYSRTGYNIILALGSFMGLLNYDATLSIKRTDGSYTDVINFSR